MSKRITGILLILAGVAAFHLLGSEPETAAKWYRSVGAKIFSDPVSAGDHYVFLGGEKGKRIFKLFEIDANGRQSAESVPLPNLPFPPIVMGDKVIVGDSARMVRGFTVPGLKLEWESGTIEQFKLPPIKATLDKFLIQSTANSLFCLDSNTGKPVWDKTFTDTLVNYATDKVIVCIHGFKDLKIESWKATALNPEDGSVVWTITLPLSQDTPLFVQNVCVLSSNEGEILIVDQENGGILHKNPVKGLKAGQILDETLIMLAAGGSRVVCMSLMTGNSWSTTIQSGFNGAAKYGDRLLIVDKKNLRCVDVNSGVQIWRRELDDVYNSFPHRRGIFVTHKDSFFSRNTFGSYIETGSAKSVWMASGNSLFMQPLITNDGDLLVSYDGSFRMMPKPPADQVAPTPSIPDLDPTKENIKFWKNETASPTAAASGSPAIQGTGKPSADEPETTGNSSEAPVDDGWSKSD